MDRRQFVKTAGLGAAAAAVPSIPETAQADTPLDSKAEALVARMTLFEKIGLMGGKIGNMFYRGKGWPRYRSVDTPDCERLGIPGVRFIDGSRGIRFDGCTCFPVAMARGATWDADLEERVGEAIGYEGRGRGANFFAGVCINVLMHPSWGRSQETFGEDPFHIGTMGSSVVRGVQNHMMACTKHFTANNIEETRHKVNVTMDERTLREIYLPHFKMCVDAGTASIMNAYNKLLGEQCGHSKWLLRDLLKDEWGFEGFVVSDWGAGIKAAVPAANAGCDIELSTRLHYGIKLYLAVLAGKVPMANIDDSVTRIVREQLKYIHLEGAKYDLSRIGGEKHAALAREVGQKCQVLLKNKNRALPLDRSQIKCLAVIGDLADKVNLGSKHSTSFIPAYTVTPLQGIKNVAGPKMEIIYDDGADLASAKAAAANADATVIVVGLTMEEEDETRDRLRLSLPERYEALIKEVAGVSKLSVVLVEGGGAVTMEAWKDLPDAIVMSWYAGMEAGNAMADVIFGDANPSAKLPITFPESEDQLPLFDNTSLEVEYGYYHGYRYFDKHNIEPAFPFGFGLSYTSYAYSNLVVGNKSVARDGTLQASVDVKNTGDRPGDEIVQLYVGYKGSAVDRPIKDLKAFKKVSLDANQKKTVVFELPIKDLAYYDVEAKGWKVEQIEHVLYIGPSSRRDELLVESFRVV